MTRRLSGRHERGFFEKLRLIKGVGCHVTYWIW